MKSRQQLLLSINGYADGGDTPHKQQQLVPSPIDAARRVLQGAYETREFFDKVASLVAGFESAFGLELLSTVRLDPQARNPSIAGCPGRENVLLERTHEVILAASDPIGCGCATCAGMD